MNEHPPERSAKIHFHPLTYRTFSRLFYIFEVNLEYFPHSLLNIKTSFAYLARLLYIFEVNLEYFPHSLLNIKTSFAYLARL